MKGRRVRRKTSRPTKGRTTDGRESQLEAEREAVTGVRSRERWDGLRLGVDIWAVKRFE